MNQLSLFEQSGSHASGLVPAKARKSDPETSREAAGSVTKSGKSSADRQAILGVVRRKPGLTAGEIAAELGWGNDNVRVSRRTAELDEAGVVVHGERRLCSVKGNSMVTWHPSK